VSTEFNVTAWLESQVGSSLADVRADAQLTAKATKSAVIAAQKGGVAKRGRVSMQSRAGISKASNADSRLRAFVKFAAKPTKRPMGVTPADWKLYRGIAAGWVEAGDVDGVVLELWGVRKQ
jgi:hypothetical protein